MQIHTLDLLFQDKPGLIAAFLVETGDQCILIETGPGSTLPNLLAALAAHQRSPEDLDAILVTHIHLDHAGAAGWFANQQIPIYCHPNAARHLIDPSKLLHSARSVYGEGTEALWGTMLPAPADRVIPLQDQQSIRVGDLTIRALDTPGHARHHHAYAIADHCFTGDVAGVRLTQNPYISVAAAPPQFDPPAYLQSIDRLLAEDFSTLYLTHFGTVTDVRQHLQRYRQRIQSLIQLTDNPAARDLATAYCCWEQEEARHLSLPGTIWQCYEQINPTAMSAQGVQLWHQGKPPAKA